LNEEVKNEMGRAYSRQGEKSNPYRDLVGKAEGKRPVGRPRHREENNIMMDLREIEFGGTDWIHLAQDRDQWRVLVNVGMKLRLA
jgi:hypothetical protein